MSEFGRSKAEVGEALVKSLQERVESYLNSDFAIIQKLLLLKYLLDINLALENREYEEIPESPQVKVD